MRFRWILKRANFETAVSVVEWGNCCSHCKHHFSEANSEISLFFFKPRKSFPPFSSLMTTNEGLRVKFFYKLLLKKGHLVSQNVFGGVSGWRFNNIQRTKTQPRWPQVFSQWRSALHLLLPCMFMSGFISGKASPLRKPAESWSPAFLPGLRLAARLQLHLSLFPLALLSARKGLRIQTSGMGSGKGSLEGTGAERS